MVYWRGRVPGAVNIRLFEAERGWRQYEDQKDADGRTTFQGASRSVELALSNALNASNLVVLTGAGSSFCAKNPPGSDSAPGMEDLWQAVEADATPALMADIIGLIPNAAGVGPNIEKLLTFAKLYVALFDDGNSRKIADFIPVAEKAILKRVDFVRGDTDIGTHRTFIRKIARRGLRKPRARIFTTNYDLCFERAAQQQQFVVIDGFSHSAPQIYDRAHFSYDIVRREGSGEMPDYIENVVHLYKLHGSLDWRRKGNTILRSKDSNDGDPVLIYPRDSKYQEAFDTPFLDMLGALQIALREPDTALLISGFGFNDDHISRPIMSAIEANMTLRVVVCDIGLLDDVTLQANAPIADKAAPPRTNNPYLKRLHGLCTLGDKRITLLNGRFEDLCDAVPDLVAQTERERFLDRISRSNSPSAGEVP